MLVDTDVLIWFMRGDHRAATAISELPQPALSVVTYVELVQGMRNKLELNALRVTLTELGAKVLPISEIISTKAMFYVEQHFLSHSLRLADALIAATAVSSGLPLLTANTKHYAPIKELALRRFRPSA
jgi:predicted nucleic acid-binding protein